MLGIKSPTRHLELGCMEAVYRLAAETPGMSRGSLENKATDRLGRYVGVDQVGTALAWARAARAVCRGREPARAAYLSPGGLRNPGRKGDIATRVAAALVAADAGEPPDGVKAAYLKAGRKKYSGLGVQAADHANRAVWLVGLVKKWPGGLFLFRVRLFESHLQLPPWVMGSPLLRNRYQRAPLAGLSHLHLHLPPWWAVHFYFRRVPLWVGSLYRSANFYMGIWSSHLELG